jgi:hypothetical protein
MNRLFQIVAAAAVLGAITSCSNDNTTTTSGGQTTATFNQVDRLGKGANAYLFIPWASRNANNIGTPTLDDTTMRGQIATFMASPIANARSSATISYTSFILAPDVLYADFSQYGVGASYLGIETNGKLNKNGTVCTTGTTCTGSLFGGRDFTDDIWTANLGFVFGNTVALISPLIPCPNPVSTTPCTVADDGKEQNGAGGTPNLTTDNVPAPSITTSVTFPFLPAAR